jgi:hypothetical protein
MRKPLAIVAILVAVLGFASIAYGQAGLDFKAELTGSEEVPPVITATTGEAKFEVNSAMTEVAFELEIEDAQNIFGAAGAHIHCLPAGETTGPVVVFLAGQVPGGFDGKVEIKGTFTQDNIVNAACGSTLAELVQSMQDGETYVNAHSTQNPGGEIRGQIVAD